MLEGEEWIGSGLFPPGKERWHVGRRFLSKLRWPFFKKGIHAFLAAGLAGVINGKRVYFMGF